MIVTSVANSHQRSDPGKPNVTARLNRNATVLNLFDERLFQVRMKNGAASSAHFVVARVPVLA
jgi:hypothetical protein